jgi:hypothetical protein
MAAKLFHVAPGVGCELVSGAHVGVQRVKLTALVDIELWAACATGTYDYGCNHEVVQAGDTVELPRSPIGVYDALQGPHYHVRQRATTPHSAATFPWIEVRMPLCTRGSTAPTEAEVGPPMLTLKPLAHALVSRAAYATTTAELAAAKAAASTMYHTAHGVAPDDAAAIAAGALTAATNDFARGSGHPLARVRAALRAALSDHPVIGELMHATQGVGGDLEDATVRWVRRAANMTTQAEYIVLGHATRALFAMALASETSIGGAVALLGEVLATAIVRVAQETRRRVGSVARRMLQAVTAEVPAWMSHAMHVLLARGLLWKEEIARLLRRALEGHAEEAAAGLHRLYEAVVARLGDARRAVAAMAHALADAVEAAVKRARRMTVPLVLAQLRGVFDSVPPYVHAMEHLL